MSFLPFDIQERINLLLEKISPNTLAKASKALSSEYKLRIESPQLDSNEACLAYIAARLPATYSSAKSVFKQIKDFEPTSLFDIGSGPGTLCIAAFEAFQSLERASCVEENSRFVTLGKTLLATNKNITWHNSSFTTYPPSSDTYDLCTCSYVLSELDEMLFFQALELLWQKTKSHCAIIEPGTPLGYRNILKARDWFLSKGGKIVAPCPHAQKCPMTDGVWCHFSTRVQRTKMHMSTKEASCGYEDEKYSYLIIKKQDGPHKDYDRIVHHPKTHSGHVELTLCTHNGTIEKKTVTRKNKTEYRQAKKSHWGDAFSI